MKTTKIFSFIAALLAMLMVLSACGVASGTPSATQAASQSADTQPAAATEKAADPVTITYCNFNSSGGNEETLAKMVEAFEASHPDIKVDVETIGYDDYFTQMQTRVAGGTAPDCYELNIENFAAYANKGLLAEISGVDVSGLNDTALNAFCVNGKQYGLPESFAIFQLRFRLYQLNHPQDKGNCKSHNHGGYTIAPGADKDNKISNGRNGSNCI